MSALLVGFIAIGAGSAGAQELYYGDDDDMSPEEYYLEGIGYGDSDYGSGGVEDSSYSGLYSPSASDAIYGGNSYNAESATGSVDTGGYALPASPSPGGAGLDAGDWFSMSGVSILEAVGDEANGRILITKDQAGSIQLLKEGDEKSGAFKVLAIGAEQARVEPANGGAPKVVPILHRSAPLDSFLAASARLQNLRLVIGSPIKREVSYEEGMQNIETGFAPLLAQSNLFLKRFDDVIVVRNAAFLDGSTVYKPAKDLPEGNSVDFNEFRGSGDELLDKISTALPAGTGKAPESLPMGTTAFLGSTPAAEALHYLNLAWTTQIPVARPKVVAKAGSKKLSQKRINKLYAQAVKLSRAGKIKAAGKRLRYICKNGSENPKHFQALGKIYWKLGRISPAVRAWKAGYKLDPSNKTSRRLLVRAKRKIRKARKARSS
jgi:hypothetical protein